MANDYILAYWFKEKAWSVIVITSIRAPRVSWSVYKAGHKVEAVFKSRIYPAYIVGRSDNKKELENLGAKLSNELKKESDPKPKHVMKAMGVKLRPFLGEEKSCTETENKSADLSSSEDEVSDHTEEENESVSAESSEDLQVAPLPVISREAAKTSFMKHKSSSSRRPSPAKKTPVKSATRMTTPTKKTSPAKRGTPPVRKEPSAMKKTPVRKASSAKKTPSVRKITVREETPSHQHSGLTSQLPVSQRSPSRSPSPSILETPRSPTPPAIEKRSVKRKLDSDLRSTNSDRFVTYGELQDLLDGYVKRSEFRKFKKRKEAAGEPSEVTYNGHTEEYLTRVVETEKNAFDAVDKCMGLLFTREEIKAHSATGKKPNKLLPAKPKFDYVKYGVMARLVKNCFNVDDKTLVLKVQSVKRKYSKE